ncbi:MAG: Ig-like domain-containing protein [Patescibacteria group bacterium]
MKKEVFLAIAIGFALGLVITFGIWTANKSLKNLPQPSPTTTSLVPSPTPTNLSAQAGQLTLSSPEDELLTSADTVTLSGKAPTGSTVIVTYEDGEKVLLPDASGNFTASIDLISGFNIINVYSYDAAGNESSQSLTVTYSTAKI